MSIFCVLLQPISMFLFEGPTVSAVAAASLHGLTDFGFGTKVIVPYTAGFILPASNNDLHFIFAIASVNHFSKDVGLSNSLGLHLCLVFTAMINIQASFFIFSLYYCGLHVPLHLYRTYKNGHIYLSIVTAITIVIIYQFLQLYIFDWHLNVETSNLERLIISHVISEFLFYD